MFDLLELGVLVVVLVFGEGGFVEVEEVLVLGLFLDELGFTVDFNLLVV